MEEDRQPRALPAPPVPEKYDRRVRKAKGTSFALEMRPEKLERNKLSYRSHTERYLQLIRINGAYRRELVFFRTCFEPSRQLVKQISGVAQLLILHPYFYPGATEKADNEINDLASQLLEAVQQYENIMKTAEDDWIEMTEQEARSVRAVAI